MKNVVFCVAMAVIAMAIMSAVNCVVKSEPCSNSLANLRIFCDSEWRESPSEEIERLNDLIPVAHKADEAAGNKRLKVANAGLAKAFRAQSESHLWATESITSIADVQKEREQCGEHGTVCVDGHVYSKAELDANLSDLLERLATEEKVAAVRDKTAAKYQGAVGEATKWLAERELVAAEAECQNSEVFRAAAKADGNTSGLERIAAKQKEIADKLVPTRPWRHEDENSPHVVLRKMREKGAEPSLDERVSAVLARRSN